MINFFFVILLPTKKGFDNEYPTKNEGAINTPLRINYAPAVEPPLLYRQR